MVESEHLDMTARKCANELMKEFTLESDERVAVVGIGTGAFIALAICKLLVREFKTVPAKLWVIEPPNVLPYATTMQCGALVDCPIEYMMNEHSVRGEPWRYEVSTLGPFTCFCFDAIDQAVSKVVQDLSTL